MHNIFLRLFIKTQPSILMLVLLMTGFIPSQAAYAQSVPDDLSNLILETPKDISQFSLLDHRKQVFNQDSLKNKWTFIFFGYTHCPDVCPTTMTEMNDLARRLPPEPPKTSDLQFVFVSVDPKRDTLDELAKYIDYFNKDFLAATASEVELKKLTAQLGIKFSIQHITKKLYGVNHSSAVLLIDPKARYYARFRAPHYGSDMSILFRKIRNYFEM